MNTQRSDNHSDQQALNKLRIVFMGTPEFAVASLEAMLQAGCTVVAVVTAPDKPAGRGMKLTASAVKQCAIAHGIPVLQPEKLKAPEFIEVLRNLKADVQVVVAFRMLPEIVWNMPPLGTINVHASLLPQYRGAAPINWAVINGEKETGVTTFRLKHEIDTGGILRQEKVQIEEQDDAGSVHDKLKEAGARLLVKTLEDIALHRDVEIQQEDLLSASVTLQHAPKIFTETCRISWQQNGEQVRSLIRGLSPYPGAFTYLKDKIFKIYQAEFTPDDEAEQEQIPVGDWQTDGKKWLRFRVTNGWLYPKIVQPEGKKKMGIEDFLRGWKS